MTPFAVRACLVAVLGAALASCDRHVWLGDGTAQSQPAGADASFCDDAGCCLQTDPLSVGDPRNDAYDCLLLELTARYGEPDPMIFKAQIAEASGFDPDAIGPETPCGVPAGWTAAESAPFGLMQVTVACNDLPMGRLADGHPNLTRDPAAALWSGSIFNPRVNIETALQILADHRRVFDTVYPSCTQDQKTLMILGAYFAGATAIGGCDPALFDQPAQDYVTAVLAYDEQFVALSGWQHRYSPAVAGDQ